LDWVHQLMTTAREEGLSFVPFPQRIRINASLGTSIVEWEGCAWEITDWMPGKADFHAQPTNKRLENVLKALAKLHRVWREHRFLRPKREGPCPAIARRLQAIGDFHLCRESLSNIRFDHLPSVLQDLCQKAIRILPFWMEYAQSPLQNANRSRVLLQYCLCDIWHDHVLFEGNKVRGIIDYGGVKIDHISVDLARLLGSLIPDQPDRVREALRMYQAFSKEETDWYELVDLLDWTGVVIGVFNWVRWLGIEKRKFDNLELVSKRMSHLQERLQRLAIRLRISIPR
jgi:Ser/Thr protein kinase RdoA (MazF antagonist)